ncbi:glycosyltransferase [Microcoleus sp. FACHB-1515]|uniref:glycosyltransferase n=1 Tax=Cyanophyceae TaxID=3028117 RepID=UPI001687582E|nr:glycosyltransferase [Microcoleus sp. FACHB-1515]MBD2092212.1 glycosyltransferase [Microcoleus sp. FACHB-1515]
MPYPTKVVEIELSQSIPTLTDLNGYRAVQALVRLHGVPIASVNAPIEQDTCSAHTLSRLILDQHHDAITRQLLHNGLAAGLLPPLKLEALLELTPPARTNWPLITVAVCWGDRTIELSRCLSAIVQLDYPNLDLLVVDYASPEPAPHLVKPYSTVRYLHESSLSWVNARDRALAIAKGEIVAFPSSDAQVERGWLNAIADGFASNPKIMAVTGLVMPAELETDAQWYEQSSTAQGFKPRCVDSRDFGQYLPVQADSSLANIAYRRSLFAQLSGFANVDGGDLELIRRIVQQGYLCVYEPQAIVRQCPPRSPEQLRDRLFQRGKLAVSQITSGADGSQSRSLLVSLVKLFYWHLWRLVRSTIHPTVLPRDFIWAELRGSLTGLMSFVRRSATDTTQPLLGTTVAAPASQGHRCTPTKRIAIRSIELAQPLAPLDDLSDYESVQLYFTWKNAPIAQAIRPTQPALTLDQLRSAIVEAVGLRLLDLDRSESDAVLAARVLSILRDRWSAPNTPAVLPPEIAVSIVVGTCDRPDMLRQCLASLTAQQSPRSIEIIVVDNRPESGLTPPIVAEFPGVVLCCEGRAGVAYARNAGIVQSQGEIIVTVDDDVVVPPDWLEKLIAPFTRVDVLAVTGNVLPIELDTPAQCLFEQYGNGGLGRGFARFEADRQWFVQSFPFAVPTWELGATANSAFRAAIFHDPAIGLMDEALGPGMPSGVGEDIYLFYKILKAGATIIYEPTACVWHQHRRDRAALARQLYGYSKGIVSYHLTTLLNDGDWRALLTLFVGLPLYYTKRIVLRLLGQTSYPLSLLLTEIRGNLVGAWALWKSHQRVRQQGRSTPYLPPSQRSLPAPEPAFSSR